MSRAVVEKMENMDDFLAYAVERQRILERRRAGQPWPWTDWPVLQKYRFCNIYREDDRTTIWFRENIREPLRNDPKVLLATVAFRWFNRIETGERIKDILVEEGWNRAKVRERLQGVQPICTGAFMIKSPAKKNKLEGLCDCIDAVAADAEHLVARIEPGETTLEDVWDRLREYPFLGNFMAYEVVTDLRHTYLLDQAPDINTWACPGPGAARGLGRVIDGNPAGYNYYSAKDQMEMILLMRHLLAYVNEKWPEPWPRWEMREVEHTLCEYDKFKRAQSGEGRLKRGYTPPSEEKQQ